MIPRHLACKMYIHSVPGNKFCDKKEQIKDMLMSVQATAKIVDRTKTTAKCRK